MAQSGSNQPLTRITYNLNQAMPGNIGETFDMMHAWQPTAIFGMNSLNMADPNNVGRQLKTLVESWNGIYVYREYEPGEPNLAAHYSTNAYLDKWARYNCPGGWWQCGNEPVFDKPEDAKRLSDWYAELIVKALQRGFNLIVPGGMAAASYETWEINWWHSMLQALWEARNARDRGYGRMMFGVHEYGHADIRLHTDGADVRQLMLKQSQRTPYKTRADIDDGNPDDNYLIRRGDQYLDYIAEFIAHVPLAQVMDELDLGTTEFLLDRMPNVEIGHREVADFVDAKAGQKVYGAPTVGKYYAWMYDMADEGAALMRGLKEEARWAEEIYPKCYRFLAWFSKTSHNAHPHYWATRYNPPVAFTNVWKEEIRTMTPPTTPVPVYPPPVPKPANPGVPEQAQITADYRVREGPGTTYKPLGILQKNQLCVIWRATRRQGGAYWWIWVEAAGNLGGWVADEGQFRVPLPTWWATEVETAFLNPAPYVSQILAATVPTPDRYNNCGEANLAMALQQQGVPVTIAEVMAFTDNEGAYLALVHSDPTVKTMLNAAQFFAPELTPRVIKDWNLHQLLAWIKTGGSFVALINRGKLELNFGNFSGAHYVLPYGATLDKLVVHDPLGVPQGPGEALHLPPGTFEAAWESSPGNNYHYQALLLERGTVTPPEPPEPEPLPPGHYLVDEAWLTAVERASATGHANVVALLDDVRQ